MSLNKKIINALKILAIPLSASIFPANNTGMSAIDQSNYIRNLHKLPVEKTAKNSYFGDFSSSYFIYQEKNDYSRELTFEERKDYQEKGFAEIEKIIYAEAANQSDINRRLVARTILNRLANHNYSHPLDVIYEKNAFTCTFDGSRLWRQAKGKLKMNRIEGEIFLDCKKNAVEVYLGKRENIPREDEIIAYYDISIKKPRDGYWNSLEEVYRNDRLVFCAPKRYLIANSYEFGQKGKEIKY